MKSKEEEGGRQSKIRSVMKKYGIEKIGGCTRCQPPSDFGRGWDFMPDELGELLPNDLICCEELDKFGRTQKNRPMLCKYKGKGEEKTGKN